MSLAPLCRRALLALACCSLILGACAAYDAVAPATTAPAPAEPPPPPELTEEQKIVARYIEAVGGEEAIRSYTSATTKAAFELPAMGLSGDTTIYQMAPDKYMEKTVLPGIGETVSAYDGEIAWAEDPMQGNRLLDGQMLRDQARNARFYSDLEYDDIYPEQQAVGETEWDGQPVHQLDLVDADGNESSHYFAKDTGLLVGIETTQTSEMGTAEISISSSDYKDFGGIMLPTRVVLGVMGMEITQTIESVTWDDVDPSVFEPSAAIKALLPE